MTDTEVACCMVEHMYVKREAHRIDLPLTELTGDFIRHIERRFTPIKGQASPFSKYADLDNLFAAVESILAQYPQGPKVMAAKFSTIFNEPSKGILDGIHNGHIAALPTDVYGGPVSAIRVVGYFSSKLITSPDDFEKVARKTTSRVRPSGYRGALPDADSWLGLLAGETYSSVAGITNARGPATTINSVAEKTHFSGYYLKRVEIRIPEEDILIDLMEERAILGKPTSLPLRFRSNSETGAACILVEMEGRNDRTKEFCYRVRFGEKKVPLAAAATDVFDGGLELLRFGQSVANVYLGRSCIWVFRDCTGQAITDLVHAVGNNSEAFAERSRKAVYTPTQFATLVGWKAIKAIFPKATDGDVLNPVHLSNSFRILPGAEPLKKHDFVETRVQISTILNQA
ncbi:hypothetical protein C7212DRAFT_340199 [Tuber magnatum]|uniref:Fatty acid synthase meander beta sheet domain-containing protein n=1 Tax=Tuber magnatum TaxID=42249 RepID=A0A317T1K4_9PEZI|nr:hypothetical protein C7212DRAFT_340199 [Tuber magnatum]